ncbi:nitroreductase [Bosea sp. (in: a-proteobacteria)]|jgi:nitroreductase|uniref:nitroreductase n=1 Tax=Bosea sp. (in: a-proteobacteria) TaxID=1871050 RepID=UPI002DDCB35F|nr:nitroreductase [Bosea sp. (in: a-proteobacteria)]HEV2511731.1 nitroreductase [Bosea sp. (in: a-proteobacteria)]
MSAAAAEAVEKAIASRRAVRAFLPNPVDPALVRRLIELAAQAPSGTNMQPWRLRVLGPRTRVRLETALIAALDDPSPREEEYRYYPTTFREPYLSRRRKVGWDLYGLLGVAKGDHAGMRRQTEANLRFFGAPVALMLTVDRDLEIGSWLDLGAFVQTLLIAAQGHGLESCPQAIFARFHQVVRRELGIPESEVVVCGIALGKADPDAPANRLVPEREPVEGFTSWLD